jgi:outer membrane protein
MKKKLFTLAALTCASFQLCAAEQKVGIVNFDSCIVDSKLGKQEQNAFETMRKQFVSLVEDTDKQLREISDKLQDKDYLDGLSKEAEEQMKTKGAQLSEELNRYQQQYYQFMHQGQNKIMQTVVGGINHAAEQIAAAKGYTLIINKNACFFSKPELDVTAELVREMDKSYEIEEKKQAAVTAPKDEVKKETVAAPKVEAPAKK